MVSSKHIHNSARIILDEKLCSILIDGLRLVDREVYEVVAGLEETERPGFIIKALRIGFIALRDMMVAGKIDFVKKEFQRLRFDLDRIFQQSLGKEGMKGDLDRIFGDDGKLEDILENLFGKDGRLVRDILDMNNKNSPIGQLREKIEAYFVGRGSEMYNMLDPSNKDSPMSRLRQDVMDELDRIRSAIEAHVAKEEIIEKTPKKGFDFEDMLESFLLRISRPFSDSIGRVSKEKGKLGGLQGDFVITVNDPMIRGPQPRIVIEAKTSRNIRLTQKGLLGELDNAMKNREAQLAIAVTKTIATDCYREIGADKIICAFEDNGLPLEVAYRVARTRLLLEKHKEKTTEIDIARINGIIIRIRTNLNSVQGIKAKLTKIGNTSETITTDLKSLETNIREGLNELQNELSCKDPDVGLYKEIPLS